MKHKHEWQSVYYGDECKICGLFVPAGSGWWLPDDDCNDDTDFVNEEVSTDDLVN